MSLNILDFKVYMPAKDIEMSKRFYLELGFKMTQGWGGTADFTLGAARFRLQDYYVADWANNFMIVIGVDDTAAWHDHAKAIIEKGSYGTARVIEPENIDGSIVSHVVDPSGVLLVFVQ